MVLNTDPETDLGWYVVHTTFKIDDASQLQAILDIIANTAPWIVSNVSVSIEKLKGWEEVDKYL